MRMEPVRLGRSGLLVSPICLGTMQFGTQADLETSRRIADLALDHGVFFWDTADMYGAGASESVCGALLAGRRREVVLATKAWADMGRDPNDRGLSARHLIEACDDSLRRLRTDWIDLYYLHLPDSTPLEETLRAAEDLVRSGRVRYVACSNYRAWQVVELLYTARLNRWQPISAVQPLYNVVNRDIEVELLPMAQAMGLGVVTYSPLARGVLTNKYARGGEQAPEGSRLERGDRRFLQAEWRPSSVAIARQLALIAAARGCTPGQLATAWAMANRLVHSVIIGPRTVAQAEEALGSIRVQVDAELESAVDDLVPPGCHSGRGFPDRHYSPVLGRVTG